MPKRRAIADSDEENDSEPVLKRSRTNESDEEDRPRTGRATRGKEVARNETIEVDDDEDDAGVEPDADEEAKFEAENEERIRERVMNRSRSQGGIAEMGIIESIEMHQFMCHKYLTFSLGPQINFIIGHNGSGKSAVLSALTVALGGKATSTGRGSGLKSFIREGQAVSEVTVVLKNQGEEAYRPKEYGRSIVITRRFTKEGASSYKIKSRDGKVISTKREELQAICDHMNIQVDNPMNILTQDSARQFLSASTPADKYKFFLKGTQLSQLSEEYQTCMENISQTAKVLKRKSEVIPDLEEALAEARARWEEAEKAREQKNKSDELKKELAWAHELEKQLTEVAHIRHRVERCEAQVAGAQADRIACNEKVAALEEELDALGNVENLNRRRDELGARMKANKTKLSQLRADEKSILESKAGVDATIAELEKKIADEQARLETRSKEKRDRATAQLEQLNATLAETEQKLTRIVAERQRLMGEADAAKTEGGQLEQEQNQLRTRVMECEEQIRKCAELEKNTLAQYGSRMDWVLSEIKRRQWHGQPPVGPFGLYVKVRDPERWGRLLRVVIGSAMSSFAITDARDRAALAQILHQSGNRHSQIIISEVDLFDFSGGEPPPEYLTILRALEVNDEYVLRQLVNNLRIESTLLAPNRAEADKMLMNLGTGGVAMGADLYRVVRFPEGGGQSSVINDLRHNDPKQHLFRGSNADAERRRWQGERDEYNARLMGLGPRITELKATYQRSRAAAADLERQEREVNGKIRQLRTQINNIQLELNEDLPVNIQALQEALDEQRTEKESIVHQYEQLIKEREKVQQDQRPLMEESDNLRVQISQHSDKRVEISERLSAAVTERMKADNSIKHFSAKADAEREKLAAAEDIAKTLEEEFEAWSAKASEYCLPYPNPRKVDVVKRNLDAVEAALKERERRQGATIEEIADELHKKEAALATAKMELRALNSLNRALRKSVKLRLARWHEFRRHIALRCKVYFQYHLSNRGYFGKVLFDHVQGKLDLRVQTDDQTATQQETRDKDPRSLSGGEKSFSTICLLLSLWESIGCPIRCLDEFDVFMDAVNRRISMKMMIDTANASKGKQYILITPQDMSNVKGGPTVRIHRMSDPERGQGTLAFR
ncbi:P-loop containing nucleoside triphosphate hydrolase protein [Trametes coccinea BRFM310]|uniref:p-loop containing nucleoside triphosphate hydrolase protein n=1 Tax=Trametes coccinea (strain BRFM310) TaxID=1353009 RepID=A0A1Y2J538_TRAC3|nr:P-loop containing nucleoside triphosphate hydrolase protein [Trametes coccinea BRFM310]